MQIQWYGWTFALLEFPKASQAQVGIQRMSPVVYGHEPTRLLEDALSLKPAHLEASNTAFAEASAELNSLGRTMRNVQPELKVALPEESREAESSGLLNEITDGFFWGHQ